GGSEPQFEKDASGKFDFTKPLIKPETMNDIEAGTGLIKDNYSLNLNLFYMIFQNEIVKKGQTDRFGQPITGNAERTIHSGAELSGVFRGISNLEIMLNGTFSKNFISSGLSYVKYKINNSKIIAPIDLGGNSIAGFPDFLMNVSLKYVNSGLNVILTGRYVGKSYSDNYGDKLSSYISDYPGFIDYNDNVIDPYFTANMFISYQKEVKPLKSTIKIYGQVNNLFDNLYAAYAIGKEYFPAAERNFMAGVQFEF
ncbi:MAG: TonB-dependent receptor domain-containing protein, partial [Syntrophothermus sp.]